jgi:hypothetical protein
LPEGLRHRLMEGDAAVRRVGGFHRRAEGVSIGHGTQERADALSRGVVAKRQLRARDLGRGGGVLVVGIWRETRWQARRGIVVHAFSLCPVG